MRTLLLLCCTTFSGFSSNISFSQDPKVSINSDKTATIFEVFDLIGKQTEYTFLYKSDIFNDLPAIRLKNGMIKVMTLLSQCLPASKYIISNKNNLITIIRKSSKDLQQEIKGKIRDGSGMPIAGAAIMVIGTNRGAASDFDGQFTIAAKPTDTLKISYLGYTTLTVPVNSRNSIDITLQEDATTLGEVQINAGYYTTTDRERTGSIARITAKDIEGQPVNNPLGAMQGYMSGVDIVQKTGVPGGGYDIQIRGKNFIKGGTEPLYVVDGMPFSTESLGSRHVSGEILFGNISPLNSINTNDIESIEVLKDADATAIYGSRGANGVVLITTKKVKAGRTRFSTNFSSTMGKVTNDIALLNTEEFLELRREGIVNDGYGPYLDMPQFDFFWPDLKWDNTRYTNWQKELIGGTAHKNRAELSVTGGSEHTQFLISGAYHRETTVFPGNAQYKKATIHNKLNHQSNNNRFKLGWSTLYSNERNQLPRTDFSLLAYTLQPNAPKLYGDDGKYNWENNTFNNPIATLEEEYHSRINSMTTNVTLGYLLTPNLELKSNLGYSTYDVESNKILPSSARNPKHGFTPQNYATLNTNDSKRRSWIAEPQLNWSLDYGKLKVNVLLGTTFQHETTQQIVLRAKGFPNNNLIQNLSAAETVEVLEDANSEYNYQAVFGRVNLNYQDKYILNLTGRRDGSSRFGPGRQFGNFGAIGAAWIFSQEPLFRNSSALSYGKFRASLGTTGSDNIGDYQFLSTYKVLGYDYNGVTALAPSGIFNPIFGWEENKKLEAALELGFFKDRVAFNMGWFRNRSANQLIGIPLPATTGFSELNGNFDATVENTGFEIDIQTNNISTDNFHWTTTFNLTIPRNKLVKFDDLASSTFRNRLIIGQPITIIKLYHSLGVNSDTGFYEFEDYNQDGIINQEDKQWVENLSPDFYGGFGNQLSYKNFTLHFFFQFKKQKAFNNFRANATPGLGFNGTTNLLDRWKKPGDQNLYQRASAGLIGGIGYIDLQQSESNAAVSDGSFIRLRNISINYQLPSIKENLKINIYLQGQNLWTITKYEGSDPEQKSFNILPPLKNITLGVQAVF